MHRIILSFIFSFIVSTLFCQDNAAIRILFQGKVFDAATLLPLTDTKLTVNSRFMSVSKTDGSFAVYLNIHDTLELSRIGYRPARVVISDTLIGKQYVAGIFMNSDTLDIGEVVIVPRNSSLRSEIIYSRSRTTPEIENARNNVAISAYQGRTTTGKLGDPASNYQLLRQQQKISAYEKGGIPSDRIAGISPFMLLPAAYLLFNGLPDRPDSFKPDISDDELHRIMDEYLKRSGK